MRKAPKLFSEIEIGDEIGPEVRVPTSEMVQRYVEVSHLQELRFFFDSDHARRNGFEEPIVPGPLSAAFVAQMLLDHFSGWRLRVLNTTFRTPVAHGEVLTLWGTVTEKDGNGGTARVHCDVVVENARGERVIVGTAVLEKKT